MTPPAAPPRKSRKPVFLLVAAVTALLAGMGALAWFRTPPTPAGSTGAPGQVRKRPNLVLFSLCSLRADRVGAMGGTRQLTPNIDGFAGRGTSFLQAFTQGLWTRTSHYALFTGRYPTNQNPVLEAGTSLADILKAVGYENAGFTDGAQVSREFGFATGFDVYEETPDAMGPGPRGMQRAVKRGLEWLDARSTSDRPFFLFLQSFDTHPGQRFGYGWDGRLSCPAPTDPACVPTHRLASRPDFCICNRDGVYYSKMPGDLGKGRPENLARENARLRQHAQEYGAVPITMAMQKHLESDYDISVREADVEFGKLVKGLEEKGLMEQSIVVVLGDHGWDLFEKGFYTNGRHGYEPVAHVPLIMAGPGVPRGERRDDTVGLIDVAPTLVDLLALPYRPTFQGTSLMGVMTKNPRRAQTYAISNTWIRSNGFELVVTPRGRPLGLYDLRHDPQERHDRRGDPALAAKVAELRELYLRVRALSQANPRLAAPPAPPVSAQTRDFLRRHGYWDKNDKDTGR